MKNLLSIRKSIFIRNTIILCFSSVIILTFQNCSNGGFSSGTYQSTQSASLASPSSTGQQTSSNSNNNSSTDCVVNCAPQAAPIITTFKSNISTLSSAGSAVLTWQVQNATQVKIDGIDVTSLSQYVVNPTTTSTYILTASNSVGSVNANITITVTSTMTSTNPGSGSDSSSAGAATSNPTSAKNIEIVFPPPSATSDSKIIVRGTSSLASISSLNVNGIVATSTDGFKTWKASVPLNIGTNILQVSAVQNGSTLSNVASVSIERFGSENEIKRGSGAWGGRILGMGYESSKNRIILADDVLDGVYEVDVVTGNRKLLSSSEQPRMGTGYESVQPNDTVAYQNISYHYDNVGSGLIFSVDLTNGNQKVIYQPSSGAGSLEFSADKKSLYIHGGGSGNESIVKFDIATNVTSVVASKSVGSGFDMRNTSSMAYSASTNKAFLTVYYNDAIYSVEMATGNRSSFSTATGNEPKLSGGSLHVHEASNKLFTLNSGNLVSIDMTTGRRAIVSSSGPLLSLNSYHAVGMTPWGPILLDYYDQYSSGNSTGSARTGTLFLIDPVEGTRVILSR